MTVLLLIVAVPVLGLAVAVWLKARALRGGVL
jgi:hypothetical protein